MAWVLAKDAIEWTIAGILALLAYAALYRIILRYGVPPVTNITLPPDISQPQRDMNVIAQSVSDQLPLNRAAYLIAHRSAWGRDFAAEYLIRDNYSPTSEQNLMQNVAHLMTEAAMKGHIEIKGRKAGEIQFEPIYPDTWQLICLDIQPDNRTLWCVSIKYKGSPTKEQKDRMPQYESLSISESALRREWPEKDCKIDASTKKFLRKAKRLGVNQQEIDKLWPK